jgi:hypothetical protein
LLQLLRSQIGSSRQLLDGRYPTIAAIEDHQLARANPAARLLMSAILRTNGHEHLLISVLNKRTG